MEEEEEVIQEAAKSEEMANKKDDEVISMPKRVEEKVECQVDQGQANVKTEIKEECTIQNIAELNEPAQDDPEDAYASHNTSGINQSLFI